MDVTTALTGMLPAILIVAAILTAVTSAFLLWLYRRATLRGMKRSAGTAALSSQPGGLEKAAPASLSPLAIVSQQGRTLATPSAAATAAYRRTARFVRVAALVYAAGGLVYAMIMTIPWLINAGGGFILSRSLLLVINYAWPVVLVVSLVAAATYRDVLGIAGGYLVTVLTVALYGLVRNPELSSGDLAFLWLYFNAPGTILLLAFLHRRVRAVGPLVLAFMVAGVTGAFLATFAAGESELLRRAVVSIVVNFGLGATAAYVLLHVAGFAAFALLGWWLLGLIGRRYRAKRLSDQSLTVDSLWLTFALVHSTSLAFQGLAWVPTGLVAFAAYKLVTRTGFRLLRRHFNSGVNAPRLLLLRVFALGRRSERFFHTFSKWWRRSGSISLIAGPDLVTTVVEPHEFLDFVSGRLSRQFVLGEADLEGRVAELDRQPDPDGRYRVNQFFCYADTWQLTMRRLAGESDAVLMDLRSFSRSNQGCLYELEQLLNIVPLERVVLLVDDTTDLPFLEEMLQRLWPEIDRESPNRSAKSPAARLFHVRDQSKRSIRTLLLLLLERQLV